MFEARLVEGSILKKLVDAMKDLVTDANIDVSTSGLAMQAMDSSHFSLCAVLLRSDRFDHFRADRTLTLGLNFISLSKILKCAGNNDIITMRADDEGDTINFMFETESQDRISDFEMKLMDIDSEHLGIPGQDYKVMIKMPAAEFQRICRDMSVLGETCTIKAEKGSSSSRFRVTWARATSHAGPAPRMMRKMTTRQLLISRSLWNSHSPYDT